MASRAMRTTTALLIACVWLLVSPCAAQPPRPPGLEEIFALNRVGGVAISPDGSQVAYTVSELDAAQSSFRSAVWVVSANGGSNRMLAEGSAPAWSPDGSAIAFISSHSGSRQIWLIDTAQGDERPITTHPQSVDRFQWAPNGKTIAFRAKRPAERDTDEPIVVDVNNLPKNELWLVDISTKQTQLLTPGSYSVGGYEQWFPDGFCWSPDSEQIVFTKRPHAKAGSHLLGDVVAIRLGQPQPRHLVRREGMDGYPRWSPNGKHVAFISTEKHDWVTVSYIYLANVETGGIYKVTPEFDEKIKQFHWTPDGKRILFIAGQGVSTQIFALDVEARKVDSLTTGTDVYSGLSLSKDGESIAFIRQNATTPPDVYVARLPGLEPRRVTRLNPQVETWPVVATDIVRWDSFDGMEIEGIVHKPPGFVNGKRYPLLVVPHGGPHGVMTNGFVGGEYRVFAQQGWLVFRPNFRGSGHYGERFLRANLGGWGLGDYEDVMSGVDYLIGNGLVDAGRMAISGSSYGGYMTAWTISQTNRFKAAATRAGISDVPSFIRTTDVPERFEDYLGTDARKYDRSSPMHFADNIVTPTLIGHCDGDPRVPLMQGRHLYTALLKNKVPVEFVIYREDGHGFSKPLHQRDWLERKIQWLRRWVLEPPSRAREGDVNRGVPILVIK